MNKTCKQCGSDFEIFDEDLKFYDRVSPVFGGKKYQIPSPTLCPDCRQQRRLCFRNERVLYKRKCDFSGKEIISTYAPDFEGKVYSQEVWWGDDWDPLKYGRDFDFNRSFFEQFLEFGLEAPRICVINMASENSLYTNHSGWNKNCYMCINTARGENLLYCTNYNLDDKDCADCISIRSCERCYFCTHTRNSAFCSYLFECENLTDCYFCFDCQGCQNCFCCWNLRHKKYCIYNKQYSKEEYQQKMARLMPKTWKEYTDTFEDFKKKITDNAIHKAVFIENCEDCSGDHLWGSRRVKDSYYLYDSEDCRYCYDAGEMKDCYDATEPYKEEMLYETQASFNNYHVIFSNKFFDGSNNLIYSQYCWSCSNLFGCFGMKSKKYCVFNKQYSKGEYEQLVSKIIEHMIETREWGEFFPAKMSPYAYNETVANEYYPLSKEEVLKRGWKWRDEEEKGLKRGYEVPENIEDVPDDVCEKVLVCEVTGRSYRIVPAELVFYKKMKLPIPRRHPDQRHFERMSLRNPRKLWDRECMKCGKDVKSTFAPERSEKIYCKECYRKEIY